jgi:hypothetical protein
VNGGGGDTSLILSSGRGLLNGSNHLVAAQRGQTEEERERESRQEMILPFRESVLFRASNRKSMALCFSQCSMQDMMSASDSRQTIVQTIPPPPCVVFPFGQEVLEQSEKSFQMSNS